MSDAPRSSIPTGPGRWLLIIAMVALAAQSLHLGYVVDDAFISFRYARNWVEGYGLSWNPGEPRVEGYSNFLWTVMMAGVIGLGLDPLPWSRALGLLAALVLLWLSERLARRTVGERFSGLVPLLLAANPGLVAWSGAGLETSLFTLLVVNGARLALKPSPSPLAAGVSLALASLTRPEGLLAALLIALGVAAEQGLAAVRRLAPAAWPIALAVLPHEVFRLGYYGAWLPNTFYAKTGDLAAQLVSGAIYLHRGLWAFAGGPLLLLAAGIVLASRRPGIRAALVFVAGWCAYLLVIGGDGLPMFRFLVPALPFLAIALAAAVAEALGPHPRLALAAAAGAVALTAAPGLDGPDHEYLEFDRREFVPRVTRVGRALPELLGPQASIALLPVGAVPWYSRLPTVDLFALNDPVVARKKMRIRVGIPGHSKFDPEVVVARRPDYVLMGNVSVSAEPLAGFIPPSYAAEAALLGLESFREGWELVAFPLPGGGWLNAYRRRGAPPSPVAPRVDGSLPAIAR